jgi:hypothetical protein
MRSAHVPFLIEKARVWACIFLVKGADDIMRFFLTDNVLCAVVDDASFMILKSSHCGGWKNKVHGFSHPKTYSQLVFDLKHIENTLGTLLNQIITFKNPRKLASNPKPKIFPGLEMFF